MAKKVISYITFVLSFLLLAALGSLAFSMLKEYQYLSHSPSASGIDYLVFAFYRMFFCFIALPGMLSSLVCTKTSSVKAIKIISIALLSIFAVVFIVFAIMWLSNG